MILASYPLLFFRRLDADIGYLGDAEMEIRFGWFLISCIVFNVLVNILIMVVEGLKVLKLRIKAWIKRRMLRKIMLKR